MSTNTQFANETTEQFVRRMRNAEYTFSYQSSESAFYATQALTDVTLEFGIRQAETTEKLMASLEVISDQQQNQSALLGLLVQLLMSEDQKDNLVNVEGRKVPLKHILAELTRDSIGEQLRKIESGKLEGL